MVQRVIPRIIALVAGAVLACTALAAQATAVESKFAVYECKRTGSSYRGAVDRIEVELTHPAAGEDMARVNFTSAGKSFGFIAIGRSACDLLSDKRPHALDRYILLSQTGLALDFRDKATGRAFLLYSFALQADLILPACVSSGEFNPTLTFLGDVFNLTERSVKPEASKVPVARVVELQDDILVGTPRNFRDTDGRRIPAQRFSRDALEQLDYTYRPLDEHDLARMLAAGFNYFDRLLPAQLVFLYDKPAFFDLEKFTEEPFPLFPEILFHPGFQGVEDFIDEPAWLYWSDTAHTKVADSLEAMGKVQEDVARRVYDRNREGRRPGIMSRLKDVGVTLPHVELREPDLPIWDEFYDTAFYQLDIPSAGFIHEGRYQHPETVDLLNWVFRTDLPTRPETVFLFYYSFLRGAARVFDKEWGMSIYGRADTKIARLGMKMAYDRGARYVWFWSSDRGHHVPFEEQLVLATDFTEYVRLHPRPDRRSLVRSAQHAIVLPYGFTFSVSDWDKSDMADLWHRPEFSLRNGMTGEGVRYYSVLRCAAMKMEELIRAGKEFDIIVERPGIEKVGYAQLHRVLPLAAKHNYAYPWWIHYWRHALLGVLLLFLVSYRTYRIVRWYRLRRRRT